MKFNLTLLIKHPSRYLKRIGSTGRHRMVNLIQFNNDGFKRLYLQKTFSTHTYDAN